MPLARSDQRRAERTRHVHPFDVDVAFASPNLNGPHRSPQSATVISPVQSKNASTFAMRLLISQLAMSAPVRSVRYRRRASADVLATRGPARAPDRWIPTDATSDERCRTARRSPACRDTSGWEKSCACCPPLRAVQPEPIAARDSRRRHLRWKGIGLRHLKRFRNRGALIRRRIGVAVFNPPIAGHRNASSLSGVEL
jgi:hypothetical protein